MTTNPTKDKNPRFRAVASPTGNWSITRVTPNKQVVEQMTKNERFILHQSMKSEAVCSFSHQRSQTQPTSGASNKHSLFHPALPFTGSPEPSPILKATQILQLNWKNDEDVMEGVRLAIPFGPDSYSELHSAWWGSVCSINANWCIKEKLCLLFLRWSGNTVTCRSIEFHIVQKWNSKVLFYLFYSKTKAKRLFHMQYLLLT